METTVYLIRKGRLHIIDEPGAATAIITAIKNGGQALSEFEFYRKHKAEYVAIDRTEKPDEPKYEPLSFPEPVDYGITSPQLYAMAVTYRDCIKAFIQKTIKKKPSMAGEIKKIMVLAFPMVIIVFLIFVMVVALGG